MIRAWIEPVRAWLLRLCKGVDRPLYAQECEENDSLYEEIAQLRAEIADLAGENLNLKEERDRLRAELADAHDYVFALFAQNSWIEDDQKYDHGCLSDFEQAQRYLIKLGHIKPEDCVRK